MSDPGAGSGRKNRLAREISPYLLLHQHNPVDWYPWGEEALSRAREEDRPIFLSVGYSTCYWCHVMERESFSDPSVAEVMNRLFVNVKLDREERPELDEIYMAATQLLTHQGGWPNSVFLTPELKPFFAGTYFPPEDRHGLPSFQKVLESMSHAWQNRRGDVEEQAEELARAMRSFLADRGAPAEAPPPASVAMTCLATLEERFDALAGGFGGAPKFPSPSNLFLLADLAGEAPAAERMLRATLEHMARGGIYDQLAGGFHRYATDSAWNIPHFEKMLYDNGLLLELYAREHARTGDPEMARIARETADFLEREMTAPEGGLWSAIDAETHGHEGAYYVWTLDELSAVLGPEDAGFLATVLGYDRAPFFEGDAYVLHLPLSIDEQAQRRRMSRDEILAEIAPLKEKLLAARETRDRPLVDDKVLTDWNGMAISGLAVAGRVLDDPGITERAMRAAEFLLSELRGDTLLHSWRQGQARNPAYLADYVFLVRGLLDLHETTGDERWLQTAVELTEEQIERLADPAGGFFVAAEEPDVLFRSKEIYDGAVPSSNAIAVLDLLELARRTGEGRFWELAERALSAFAGVAERQSEAARMLCLAARRYHLLAESLGFAAKESAGPAPSPSSGDLDDQAQRVVLAHAEVGEADGDGWRDVRLQADVAAGWHLYAHGESGEARSTELSARGAELRDVAYPEGSVLETAGETARVYQGRLEIAGRLRPEPDAPGTSLVLSYQACDDRRCLPPAEVVIEIV